ncbi:hypothetical protein [Polyangium aurulentum]|uniref:hypothetical protein n=1 Tax=Polyangium aurulentum TaxID=2567896 RepID=UPI0010AEDDAD|nr:hypothetical protein [Polyangium aurulentum]UQA55103.1 hypothetical protein E8A73_027550 [Polyangium aurulentum]
MLSLCACTSTVRLPATELPALAKATSGRMEEWPTVLTDEGTQKTVMGDIERITIQSPRGQAPIHTPAWAAVDGKWLYVNDPIGRRAFPLEEVSAVVVDYDDVHKPRVALGAVLIGMSTPFVIGGTTLFFIAAKEAEATPVVYGLLTTGVGLALGIPGIVLVASKPSPPDKRDEATLVRPTIGFTPGGVKFSAEF